MTKNELQEWCQNYSNAYYAIVDGCLVNTGECPFMCDTIAESIMSSKELIDVTSDAESFHAQLLYEVEHNGCSLYKVVDENGYEVVIAYYSFDEE